MTFWFWRTGFTLNSPENSSDIIATMKDVAIIPINIQGTANSLLKNLFGARSPYLYRKKIYIYIYMYIKKAFSLLRSNMLGNLVSSIKIFEKYFEECYSFERISFAKYHLQNIQYYFLTRLWSLSPRPTKNHFQLHA